MNEKPEIEVGNLPVITKFIYTLGVLPTSYLMSMTYQEQVTWLYNYLQTQVIPLLNTESAAIQELQTLYELLRTYVNDYFDNLDVQEEINNKLNEMSEDGTLTNLIKNYVDPIYQAYEDEINQEISDLSQQIQSVASGSPIPVNSVNQMVDTDRLYLLTTSGYVYYYNGTEWVEGFLYQATDINENSVTLLNLDENLQSNFNTMFGDKIDLGTSTQGYATDDGSGNLQISTNSSYEYFIYPFTNLGIYEFTGMNQSAACGLLLVDSNNKILYNSNPSETQSSSITGTYKMFSINKSGITAYISKAVSTSRIYVAEYPTLRKLNNIYNNLKIDKNVKLIQTLEGTYSTSQPTILLKYATNSSFTCYIYSCERGKKYKLSGYNMYSARAFSITNSKGNVIYASSSESYNSPTYAEYEFTATENGFIVISQYLNNPYTIEVLYDAIELDTTNKFINMKIGADGDSISAGVNSNLSYITQIANDNNCTIQNLSVGGGTIATGTYADETPRHWICESVDNLDQDCDIIMLSGGVNDYWQKVPMGVITDDYTSVVDNSTFIGALEYMCRSVLNNFKTQKIVFVTYHKINNIYNTYNSSVGERHTFKDYLDAIYDVMNKYSIPVIDINKNGRFNTALDYYKNNYTNNSDGVHPTTNGYRLFYNQIIINELNNLL